MAKKETLKRGRINTLRIGILNIVTHPHSPENYINLFKDTFLMKRPAKIRGNHWGIIGSQYIGNYHNGKLASQGPEIGTIIFGTIYRYLNIDGKGPWLDLNEMAPLEIKENAEPLIPDNLKPNMRDTTYIFFPYSHKMIFDLSKFSHQTMRALIFHLFCQKRIVDNFNMVDVHVVAKSESIRKILAAHRISNLEIDISLPNGDDLGELEQAFKDRLENQNADRYHEKIKSRHKEGIKPDKETRAAMKLALQNGKVEAITYNEQNQKKELSTEKHPFEHRLYYSPKTENRLDAMLKASAAILSR